MAKGPSDLAFAFSAKAAQLVLAIGTQSCLAWVLGPGDRGSYAVALLFLTILEVVLIIGTDSTSRYFVASKRLSLSEAVVDVTILGGLASVLAIGVGLALMTLPVSFFSKASPLAFHLALLGIPAHAGAYCFTLMLTSLRDFKWYAIVLTAQYVFQLLVTLLFVWFLSWGVEGAMLALLLSGAFAIALALSVFRYRHDLHWVKPRIESLRQILHYGLRHYPAKLSIQVNFSVGTFILAFFATKSEIGLFAVASAFITRTLLLPGTLIPVLIPRVAQDDTGRRALVAQCARVTTLLCGGILLLLAVFAKPIVRILFGPEYLAAVPLIWIMAAGVLVRSGSQLFGPYMVGTNHPGIESVAVASGTAVNLLFLWFLLPILGLPGAAIGRAASLVISSAILYVTFSRLSQMSFREIWRFQRSDWHFFSTFLPSLLGKRGAR